MLLLVLISQIDISTFLIYKFSESLNQIKKTFDQVEKDSTNGLTISFLGLLILILICFGLICSHRCFLVYFKYYFVSLWFSFIEPNQNYVTKYKFEFSSNNFQSRFLKILHKSTFAHPQIFR